MKISFLGAAKTVTGSCYLVEEGSTRFLIDCGMFQGLDVEYLNREMFKFDPKSLDCVILTHAHIDHSGLLPKLVKHGFQGKIYLTPPTSGLCNLLLLDAAKIQEINDRHDRHYSEAAPFAMPGGLYNTDDALNTLGKFFSVPFGHRYEINPNFAFTFVPAGHILGAASVYLEIHGKKLLFSGDIGRMEQALIYGFYKYEVKSYSPDFVIMESLYGGEKHLPREQSVRELLDIINRTTESNGNVIIPTFAVQRTQELLEIFNIALQNSQVNKNVQFYLDSPLAIAVTKLYTSASEYLDKNFSQKYPNLKQRFQFENLRFITHYRRSLKLSNKRGIVILAGSGMADGGRVVSHLRNNLSNGINAAVFVGYQAEGTLGRKLVQGEKKVLIKEKNVRVNAPINYLTGFSAHADSLALLKWLKGYSLNNLQQIFLVHAELERSLKFKNEISQNPETNKFKVEIPNLNQNYSL